MDNHVLVAKLDSLVVFRGVRNGKIVSALYDYLAAPDVARYADFVSALFERGYDWPAVLLDLSAEDENRYVILRARGQEVPAVLQSCADAELGILAELAALTPADLTGLLDYDEYLPAFDGSALDFAAAYEERMANISRTGYGIYARNVMFRLEDRGIVPVTSPDKMDVNYLIGYERERQTLIDNTRALLAGKPAANTLLYGDAGTGKSSTVKAVTNLLAPEGLRLIEIRKDQLRQIPNVMEELRDNPLKFIIFIDDLSFQKDDDNFSTLKAILEGSASVQAPNTAIYATSNRRHLVKESFADRDGDDIHRNDTMQELISLSGRFGLAILFSKPNKDLYLEIVHEMARAKGITMPEEELDVKAAAFATRKGGRSPRAAEQFTDSLLAAMD